MTGRLWRGGMVFGGLMLLGSYQPQRHSHFLPSPMAVAEALWVSHRAYLGWHIYHAQ